MESGLPCTPTIADPTAGVLLPPSLTTLAPENHSILRKVAIILEEPGLTHESAYLDFSKKEQKAPEILKINPNGRIPAILDHHNDDFIVW